YFFNCFTYIYSIKKSNTSVEDNRNITFLTNLYIVIMLSRQHSAVIYKLMCIMSQLHAILLSYVAYLYLQLQHRSDPCTPFQYLEYHQSLSSCPADSQPMQYRHQCQFYSYQSAPDQLLGLLIHRE